MTAKESINNYTSSSYCNIIANMYIFNNTYIRSDINIISYLCPFRMICTYSCKL